MYQIKIETINKLLNYLSHQPYLQVFELIDELKSGQVVEEKEDEKDDDK